MSEIKVSIIMPVYNAERYLDETLQSVYAQNFKDYELIAIDDGSKDSSLYILEKYKDKINNITIVSNVNSGVSKTRNQGIEMAKGEYVCFVDSDDILHEEYLNKLYKPIKFYGADISYCNYCPFYEKINFKKGEEATLDKLDIDDGVDGFDYVMRQGLGISLWNKLYKLETLKKYKIYFNENSSYGEDMFFNWKVFLVSDNIYQVNKQLYGYRQNTQGVTMKYHPDLFDCYIEEYDEMLQFAEINNINLKKLKKSININLLKRFNSICRMNIRRKDGIKKSYDYIRYILNDKHTKEALTVYGTVNHYLFNDTDKKIICLMKSDKKIRLLFLSYYLDYKLKLFRYIKHLIKKN